MKNSILVFMCVGFIFSSCGTNKKLQSANDQLTLVNTQVADLNAKLAENEKLITQLKKEAELANKDAAAYRILQENIRVKKEKLDKELAARGTSLQDIEARAESAVNRFRQAGCEVTYKNQRFHITVPDSYEYKSGRSSVGTKGREALNVVAQVMYDNPGVTAVIIGNTDTIPVTGKTDNWSLSTDRASNVVRVLQDVYNINPKRLTAAGRSKYNPVASNDTEEGRAKNRRIEIIINPNLDRLWDLIED